MEFCLGRGVLLWKINRFGWKSSLHKGLGMLARPLWSEMAAVGTGRNKPNTRRQTPSVPACLRITVWAGEEVKSPHSHLSPAAY
jgi:hypothetical protein